MKEPLTIDSLSIRKTLFAVLLKIKNNPQLLSEPVYPPELLLKMRESYNLWQEVDQLNTLKN